MGRNWREGQSLQQGKEAGRSHCPRWPLSILTARAPDPRCAERGSRKVSVQSGQDYPWRKRVKGHHYFTVYFLTLCKLMQECIHPVLVELKIYNKW